jgi:hypothetical protein
MRYSSTATTNRAAGLTGEMHRKNPPAEKRRHIHEELFAAERPFRWNFGGVSVLSARKVDGNAAALFAVEFPVPARAAFAGRPSGFQEPGIILVSLFAFLGGPRTFVPYEEFITNCVVIVASCFSFALLCTAHGAGESYLFVRSSV